MSRLPTIALWTFFVVAMLAPVIANNRPIVCRVGGELQFPGVAAIFGENLRAPGDQTWFEWWVALDDDSSDWGVMPPYSHGPHVVHGDRVRAGPSAVFWLGNDDVGRDQLARLIHAARTAALVALGAVLVAVLIGIPLGAIAGLFGGVVDSVVLRLIELFACFPAIVAAMAAATFVGGSLTAIAVVLGIAYWPAVARVVRGEFLSLREREFVQAARGLGVGPIALVGRHMLPCTRGPVAVMAAFLAANAIVVECTLSFLGLGARGASPSWGEMLAHGRANAHLGAWHLWLFPLLALGFVVVSLQAKASQEKPR